MSATYMERMQKDSNNHVSNLNNAIDYITMKMPINKQHVQQRAHRKFETQDNFKKNQLFDIKFDFSSAENLYKESDEEVRKIFANNKSIMIKMNEGLKKLLEEVSTLDSVVRTDV